MYNKTIIGFGFCDVWNNHRRGKCNQPWPPASVEYTCLDLDYSEYNKNLIQLLVVIHVIVYSCIYVVGQHEIHVNTINFNLV